MPIVATATLISVLFLGGKGKKRGSFLNPESIRTRVAKLPESDRRERALALAEELEEIAREYRDSAAAGLEHYSAQAREYRSNAALLANERRSADAELDRALTGVIRIRQALLRTLASEEWRKIFGD